MKRRRRKEIPDKKMESSMSDKKSLPSLSFKSERRFGVEFEILAYDGKSRPDPGQNVAGIDDVASIVALAAKHEVDIRGYEHTIDNDSYVVKPDGSCGMEVCTPILKGTTGLRNVVEVTEEFFSNPSIKVDERCSLHLHMELVDLNVQEIATFLAYWVKCEAIFMDSVPCKRKRNRYCQFMVRNELFDNEQMPSQENLLKKIGETKYYSVNCSQYLKSGRKTLEIRTGEGEVCRDPYAVKNWVRLLLHFMEMTRSLEYPKPIDPKDPNNQWNGLSILDLEDVMKIMGFGIGQYDLSPGLQQMRNWFLARMRKNMYKDGWRSAAYQDLNNFIRKLEETGVRITDEDLSPKDLKTALYSENLKA